MTPQAQAEALAEVDKRCRCESTTTSRAADRYRSPKRTLRVAAAVMPWNFGGVPFPPRRSWLATWPSLAAAAVPTLIPGGVVTEACLRAVFDVPHRTTTRLPRCCATHGENGSRGSIASNAGSQLKKSVMELGGSDAFVVRRCRPRQGRGGGGEVAFRQQRADLHCGQALHRGRCSMTSPDASLKRASASMAIPVSVAPRWRRWPVPICATNCTQVQASVAKGARVLVGGEPIAGTHGYPANRSIRSAQACLPTTRSRFAGGCGDPGQG